MTTVAIFAGNDGVGTAILVGRDLGITAHRASPSITITNVQPPTLMHRLSGQLYSLLTEDDGALFVGCVASQHSGATVTFLAMNVLNAAGDSILG